MFLVHVTSLHKKIVGGVVLVVVIAAALCSYYLLHDSSSAPEASGQSAGRTGDALAAREKAADETVWAKEILAQACARTFEAFWDSINAATNKFALLRAFPTEEFVVPQFSPPQALAHDIKLFEPSGIGKVLAGKSWRQWVGTFDAQGWQIENLEFRHLRFDVDARNQPAQSSFYFAARVTNQKTFERALIEGNLLVDWGTKKADEPWLVKRIDASHLTMTTRRGEPPFRLILDADITPEQRFPYSDPLIVYDLDGDGFSEIILAARNLVYHRRGEDLYQAETLCRYPADRITSAVIADFDGDGFADFLCANWRGLFLFRGSAVGRFDEPGRLVWSADPPLKNTMVLTCGDIDGDGALDVFLAQYKVPTLGQILRPFYYDANDGWPAFLLQNDGRGNFKDITEAAGLGKKRWRRTYSASLVDLDGDGHPDLVVVSDFAGLDLYRNDGRGHFTDSTRGWIAEPHEFGMAHALADFNRDGLLDLLMIGMPSPTVERLEHLGLNRGYSADDTRMRPAMAYGNRLYLARPNGGFEQTGLNESIARSGWSWGCSAFDFDNDGFPDVYIANGLESKRSVREYEPEFWLHDIFVDERVDDLAASRYFLDKFSATRGRGWSYGGYEKNRLYLNRGGASFLEIGHLAGVALEQDSRNVVTDDLDGDGRVDLLLTTLEVWPEVKQTLKIFRNGLSDGGHWIGFRFKEEGTGTSPVGARVTIFWGAHRATRQIVTGDSHRSQHANTVHFGLGSANSVDRVEIRWQNGRSATLLRPAVDTFHNVRAFKP